MHSSGVLRRIGLTGSIGAGKSTVARLLRQRGFVVLDADEQARIVTGQPEVLRELEDTFPGIVVSGVLDRPALSDRVFGHPAELAKLNATVHPRVRSRMAALEAEALQSGASLVIQDVPLLFEGKMRTAFEAVIVVDAPLETRLERLLLRGGLSREAALARDAAQMPAPHKRELADAVIDNGGDEAALETQLDAVLARLKLVP